MPAEVRVLVYQAAYDDEQLAAVRDAYHLVSKRMAQVPGMLGNELLRSPAFTLATGLVYAPAEGFGASFDVRYSDSYYTDAFNDPRGKVDPYAIANAQVSYRVGPARLFAAVTNIFDDISVQNLQPGATPAGDVATVTPPRRLSAGLEFAF